MQFDMKIWHGWKDGFKGTADSDGFGEECKTVAKRAFEIMDVLENQMSF
jgi:hypothetical protein